MRTAFGVCLLFAYFLLRRSNDGTLKSFDFLFVNMLLAYIPAELSVHLDARTPDYLFWPLVAGWLLFYPNAPYLITDFFHLAKFDPYIVSPEGVVTHLLMPDMEMWTVFAILATGIVVGVFFGICSLDHVADAVAERFCARGRQVAKFAFVASACACAGAGMYLGRFPRLHTIDVFLHPCRVLENLTAVDAVRLLQFSALMALLQVVMWCLLRTVRGR